jgi:hypothetical protein
MFIAPAVFEFGTTRPPQAQPPEFAGFSSPQWQGPMASWASWTAEPGASTRRIVADYAAAGGVRVTVLVARYASPEGAPDLPLSVTGYLPAPAWQPQGGESVGITSGGLSLVARRDRLRDPAGRAWVFLHWFQLGDRSHDSALRARLDWWRQSLMGHPPPFLALTFASECAGDCAPETAMVSTLASASAATLMDQMGQHRGE